MVGLTLNIDIFLYTLAHIHGHKHKRVCETNCRPNVL